MLLVFRDIASKGALDFGDMLNKIGGGKNPIARVSLNILVNAYMGNSCLKALSMCWAAWATWGKRCSNPNAKGRQGCVRTGAKATWGTTGLAKSMSPKEKTFSVTNFSFYGAALSFQWLLPLLLHGEYMG